ncbi:MAG: hypothetical protein JJT94_06260 [Bernardetiaceae bacterium]|nr:hypothetical protein [Bernardetiaceae bacterium]
MKFSFIHLFVFIFSLSATAQAQTPATTANRILNQEMIAPNPAQGIEPVAKILADIYIAKKYFLDEMEYEKLGAVFNKSFELFFDGLERYPAYDHYPFKDNSDENFEKLMTMVFQNTGMSEQEFTDMIEELDEILEAQESAISMGGEGHPTLQPVAGAINIDELYKNKKQYVGKVVTVNAFLGGYAGSGSGDGSNMEYHAVYLVGEYPHLHIMDCEIVEPQQSSAAMLMLVEDGKNYETQVLIRGRFKLPKGESFYDMILEDAELVAN